MIPFPVKAARLILDEYNSQLSSKMKVDRKLAALTGLDLGVKEDDGFETESDDGDPDPFSYFGEDDEFEESDEEDLVNDPIYQSDLVVTIKEWVVEMKKSHPQILEEIAKRLPLHYQNTVGEMLQ
jgi:hypothetical protein